MINSPIRSICYISGLKKLGFRSVPFLEILCEGIDFARLPTLINLYTFKPLSILYRLKDLTFQPLPFRFLKNINIYFCVYVFLSSDIFFLFLTITLAFQKKLHVVVSKKALSILSFLKILNSLGAMEDKNKMGFTNLPKINNGMCLLFPCLLL